MAPPPLSTLEDPYITQKYVARLSSAIALEAGLNPYRPLKDILCDAIQGLSRYSNDYNSYQPHSTIVIIKINNSQLEYLVLGDSYLVISSQGTEEIIRDERLKTVAAEERNALYEIISSGVGYNAKEVLDARDTLIKKEQCFLNKPNGYFMASNIPEAAQKAIAGSIPIEKGMKLLLATDGLIRGLKTYKIKTSWNDFLTSIQDNGIACMIKKIRAIESSDQFGLIYKRSSFSDDAAGILISFT
jgi:serine/threonine protein phosphatase PrpC